MSRLFDVKELDKDTVLTPLWVFEKLNLTFDLDPCGSDKGDHVPARNRYIIADNGLAQPWEGLVWCNPPFSAPEPWVRRMLGHRNGILLSIASLAGWYQDVWEQSDAVVLPQRMWGGLPYLCTLAAWGDESVKALNRLGRIRT